jgi:hypothetical protein
LPRQSAFRTCLVICCAVALLTASAAARAQNPAAAEALFEQGRAAVAAGDFETACARFRDSDRLDPALGTKLNLADCEERRGRVATAWSLFKLVLAELPEDDDRRPIAAERVRKLDPRVPRLTLLYEGERDRRPRIRMDGAELGEGSLGIALPMDPGSHELDLLRPGSDVWEKRVLELREAEREQLVIEGAAPVSASASEAGRASGAPGWSARQWGYIAGGVGALGIVLGGVTGVMALNQKSIARDNCDDVAKRCNQTGFDANRTGARLAAWSTLGFVVGMAGLGAGGYLIFVPGSEGSEDRAQSETSGRVHTYVTISPDAAYAGLSTVF